MQRRTLLGAGLASLVVLCLVTATAALVADSPVRAAAGQHIGTFNMAGGQGELPQEGPDTAEELARSVESRRGRVAFLALQEACRDWSQYLDRRLAGYTVRFDPVRTDQDPTSRCRYPDFGNAVLYRDDLGIDTEPVDHQLGTPAPYELREMLCARSRARRLVLCSTHLSYEDVKIQQDEAETIRKILATDYAGYTKLVGGDLNGGPLSVTLGSLYHRDYGRAARGELKEVDSPCGNAPRERAGPRPGGPYCRAGTATHGSPPGAAKLDYLFVSPWVSVRSAATSRSDRSDHRLLWAEVAF